MDKTAIAERLRALVSDDEKRSKTARVLEVLDEIEIALAAGARRVDVLAELQAHGLSMSLSTFETTLKRLRARRGPRASGVDDRRGTTALLPASSSAGRSDIVEDCVKSSHDPADLDRIVNTRPDLVALARLAKRSKR